MWSLPFTKTTQNSGERTSLVALGDTLFQSALGQQLCYAIGLFGMKVISFFLLPYLAGTLGTAEFARMETLLALVNGATVVVGFGLVNSLYREVGLADQEDQPQIAATLTGSALSIAGAVLLLAVLASPWLLPWLNQYWAISSVEYLLLMLLISTEGVLAVPLAWLRMRNRAGRFMQVMLTRTLLYAVLAVLLLRYDWGLTGVLSAACLAVSYQIAHLLWLQYQDSGIRFTLKPLLAQMRYGFPFIVSGLAMYASQGFDIVLLSQQISPEALAAYAIAIKFFLMAALLSQPFQLWWYPRRIQLLKQDQGLQLAANGAVTGALLALVLGVMVVAVAPVVIRLFFVESFWIAEEYLPWLVTAGILKQWGALFNLGCFTTEKSEIQMAIELGTGLLCFLLLPFAIGHYQITGALAVLLASQALRLAAYVWISQRLLTLHYPIKALLSLSPLALLVLFAPLYRTALVPHLAQELFVLLLWAVFWTLVTLISLWHLFVGAKGQS